MHKKILTLPGIKKARRSKSKTKAMLIVFFDIKGEFMVPEDETVIQHYCIEVLIKLIE